MSDPDEVSSFEALFQQWFARACSRGFCAVCGRQFALRRDRLVRAHRTPPDARAALHCPGGGQPPDPRPTRARTAQAVQRRGVEAVTALLRKHLGVSQ